MKSQSLLPIKIYFSRRIKRIFLLVLLIVLFSLWYCYGETNWLLTNDANRLVILIPSQNYSEQQNHFDYFKITNNKIEQATDVAKTHLVVMQCGSGRIRQSINLVKTTVLFASQPLRFSIFIEKNYRSRLSNELESWPSAIRRRFKVDYYEPVYPKKYEKWKHLYSQCSTLRLFLPELMNNTELVIYLDTDCLVLADIAGLWRTFEKFDSKQMFALTNESDVYVRNNWYARYSANFPFYARFGLNSGVLLMNLTRMRDFNFVDKLTRIFHHYRHAIRFFDQDVLNVFSYFNPDSVLILDCSWNLRAIHCLKSFKCREASKSGLKILHGNNGVFDASNWLPFKDHGLEAIYNSFDQYKFDRSPESLMIVIEQAILSSPNKFCIKHKREFLKPFEAFRSRLIESYDTKNPSM